VEMFAGRQREILRSAAALLRPGGILCYSTCTFAPQENEENMAWLLEEYPEFQPVAAEAPWFAPARPDWTERRAPRTAAGFRLWPHQIPGEGHFLMLLQKTGEALIPELPPAGAIPVPPELQAFLEELEIPLPPGHLAAFGQTLCLLPEQTPDLKGLKVLRPGLELGQLKKGRFEPAHALALWCPDAKRRLDLSPEDPRLGDYLQGLEIPGEQQGWTLISVDGLGLGWAKGSGGRLKNHFPKGLRWT